MICTRCQGAGFLNLEQIPEADRIKLDTPSGILRWIDEHEAHDVQVCDCCGDGENWLGTPGSHTWGPYGWDGGPVPECI